MSDHKGKKRHGPGYDDKVGREKGGKSGGRSSSSRPASSRQEPPEIPRSGSLMLDPLPETGPTTTYTAGSSRDGMENRPRRESESHKTRSQFDKGHDVRSQHVSSRRGDSKEYHESGGYTDSHDSANRHDRSKSSSTRRTSHSKQNPPSREEDPRSSSSRMHESMGRMTLDEASSNDNFVLSPQPARSSADGYDEGKGIASDNTPVYLDPLESSQRVIRGTYGDIEELDKSYTKRNRDYTTFFRPGRVFSTLWTEPFDDTPRTMHSDNSVFNTVVSYKVSYGQRVHSKIRRFIVVKTDEKSCTCLPITTYGGKGYKKKGLNLNSHGLIYSRKPPSPVKGITKKPLRILISKGAEELVDHSYLHYGRVYTVEMNVKVKEVGELDDPSRKLLRRYYKEVSFPESDSEQSVAPNSLGKSAFGRGTGPGLMNSMTSPGYNDGSAFGRSSGAYNPQNSYDNRGGPNSSMSTVDNSYADQAFYPNQVSSSSTANAGTYQYADVSQFGKDSNYNQQLPAARGISHQSYYQSDYQNNQASSATGGFASNRPIDPGYTGQNYPSNPPGSQRQSGQNLYSPGSSSFVSNDNMYAGQSANYPPTGTTGTTRYGAQAGPYYDPYASQGSSGQQDMYSAPTTSVHRSNPEDQEIHLPNEQEVRYENAQRRADRGGGRK